MMKAKVYLGAILSTSAIAASILLSSADSAQACRLRATYQQESWLNTPWAAVLTLPGVALAIGLYRGGRAYDRSST